MGLFKKTAAVCILVAVCAVIRSTCFQLTVAISKLHVHSIAVVERSIQKQVFVWELQEYWQIKCCKQEYQLCLWKISASVELF